MTESKEDLFERNKVEDLSKPPNNDLQSTLLQCEATDLSFDTGKLRYSYSEY